MDSMFRGSRAPWGRSEDRCDGAGSEADGAKPPVKPGPMLPVLGVLVFEDRSALVELPSSGLRINTARRSPGRFCPALRLVLASVPALSSEHRAPQSVEKEKASTGWKSSSSNRFCAGSCHGSVSRLRSFWTTPMTARSGTPAHNDPDTARRYRHPSAVRRAPIPGACRPECRGGRFDKP